ncbi:uncharacterized protein LOC124079320 [Marmota monax]|uniref:uncharacterized protein LOC124079320 n=1 Tax=Marmota monax TaxID=9995 RepID=UPI0026E9EFE4|nr:uncharacterized protein LOC124079320 [Marmota monax]
MWRVEQVARGLRPALSLHQALLGLTATQLPPSFCVQKCRCAPRPAGVETSGVSSRTCSTPGQSLLRGQPNPRVKDLRGRFQLSPCPGMECGGERPHSPSADLAVSAHGSDSGKTSGPQEDGGRRRDSCDKFPRVLVLLVFLSCPASLLSCGLKVPFKTEAWVMNSRSFFFFLKDVLADISFSSSSNVPFHADTDNRWQGIEAQEPDIWSRSRD